MDLAEGDRVWHDVRGLGEFRKYHKNGRASVLFERSLLPASIDPAELRPWSEVLTGSDYE